MGWRENENFKIGEMYYLRTYNSIVAIPRHQVSYVSEAFVHRPILLVLAAVLGLSIFLGDVSPPFILFLVSLGFDRTSYTVFAVIVVVVLIATYLVTRRVGIRVSSGGGNIFVVLGGKHRHEVFERIMVDLLTNVGPERQALEPSMEDIERAISRDPKS